MNTFNARKKSRRRLGNVKQAVEENPHYTESAIRNLIYRAESNGLDKYIFRVGRKVLLDLDGIPEWIEEQAQANSPMPVISKTQHKTAIKKSSRPNRKIIVP